MSDKNIEIIKAIQSTGQNPESSTAKITKPIMEGLEYKVEPEKRTTIRVFDSQGVSDADDNQDK